MNTVSHTRRAPDQINNLLLDPALGRDRQISGSRSTVTPSSLAWNRASVRSKKSLSTLWKPAYSAPSREKSSAWGFQGPSRFAFWNRRKGIESQSRPRPEIVA